VASSTVLIKHSKDETRIRDPLLQEQEHTYKNIQHLDGFNYLNSESYMLEEYNPALERSQAREDESFEQPLFLSVMASGHDVAIFRDKGGVKPVLEQAAKLRTR